MEDLNFWKALTDVLKAESINIHLRKSQQQTDLKSAW